MSPLTRAPPAIFANDSTTCSSPTSGTPTVSDLHLTSVAHICRTARASGRRRWVSWVESVDGGRGRPHIYGPRAKSEGTDALAGGGDGSTPSEARLRVQIELRDPQPVQPSRRQPPANQSRSCSEPKRVFTTRLASAGSTTMTAASADVVCPIEGSHRRGQHTQVDSGPKYPVATSDQTRDPRASRGLSLNPPMMMVC